MIELDKQILKEQFDMDEWNGRWFVNCNDVFWWGTADGEPVETYQDWLLLQKCYDKCQLEDTQNQGDVLYATIKRNLRPQGGWFTFIPKRLWHHFLIAAPERKTDVANPFEIGDYKPEQIKY